MNLAPHTMGQCRESTLPYFVGVDDDPEDAPRWWAVYDRRRRVGEWHVQCGERFGDFEPCRDRCAELNQAWLDARAARVA